MRRWILNKDDPRVGNIRAACVEAILNDELASEMVVTFDQYSPPRTLAQNAFYWSAMVTPLAAHFGYEKNEMHEVLLAEHFGTEKVGSLVLPRKRSSSLTKGEMAEYLDWVPRFAAENGVVLYV